jgi:phosphoribosylformylglycinamidine synthase
MAPALFDAMHAAIEAGSVESCHDLCEGGLAVAGAEMAMGSKLGARLEISKVPSDPNVPPIARLFSETPSRFLCEVKPENVSDFLSFFRGMACEPIGEVTSEPQLEVFLESSSLFAVSTQSILQANLSQ